MNGWYWTAAAAFVAIACWTDIRRMRIPNGLNAAFACAGLLVQTVVHGGEGLGAALVGAAAGALPLALLYRLGGMGGGDVKWFGAFGIWAGPAATLQLLLYSIVAAGAFAVALLGMRLPGLRRLALKCAWPWGEHPAQAGRKTTFPFMLAVAPAFAAAAIESATAG